MLKEKKPVVIEMSHILNAVKGNYKTIHEQRLFYIYLSRINARNPDNFIIKFTLKEFCEICNLEYIRKPKPYIKYAKNLMHNIVELPLPYGGVEVFPLFGMSRFSQDENTGEWYFEIGANLYYKDIFFNLKEYVKFNLDYIIHLKTPYQMHLYTLLKQYQNIGKWQYKLSELRKLMNIETEEYTRYCDFNSKILKNCQKIINELTDIEIEYKGIRGNGRGGAVVAVEFTISTNPKIKISPINEQDNELIYRNDYNSPTVAPTKFSQYSKYLTQRLHFNGTTLELISEPYEYLDEEIKAYASPCDFVFSEEQTKNLVEIFKEQSPAATPTKFRREYQHFIQQIQKNEKSGKKVKNYYAYFYGILENKLRAYNIECQKNLIKENENKKEKRPRSYNVNKVSDVF
jgi:plasmid replication initiation protein